MTHFSITDVTGLSRPASLLIEKVSNAIGRHFDPRQTLRMADAEAKAQHIRRVAEAQTDIEVAGLLHRAGNRLANEEVAKQRNIESIVAQAFPHLNEDARPDAVEDDWISNFFQKCSTVSDAQMAELWAKILAGEANNYGSFSRATVNLVANLESKDVKLFQDLCDFVWTAMGWLHPLIFDLMDDVYTRHSINSFNLHNLSNLGLADFAESGYLIFVPPIGSIHAYYHERLLVVPFPNREYISGGHVQLTRAGTELIRICQRKPVEGVFEYVQDVWTRNPMKGLFLASR